MKTLNDFIEYVQILESNQTIDDVLDLLPHFEGLSMRQWPSLLDVVNGEPCTTLLYHSNQIKLSLIYWKARQESSLHGHPGGGGLIKVIKGSLHETRYNPNNEEKVLDEYIIDEDSVGYIHDMFAWHQVRNPNETPAVSLHLYSLVPAEEYV